MFRIFNSPHSKHSKWLQFTVGFVFIGFIIVLIYSKFIINKINYIERGKIFDRNGCVLVTNAGTSRVYPEGGEFLCHILGFAGSVAGLEGLEYFYDKELKKGRDLVLTRGK